MNTDTSKILFSRAEKVIPGGVNSPVRAFRAVGGTPVFFEKGYGSRLRDVDGNEYIDYVMSWGPLILGHAHPEVTELLLEAVQNGVSYGAPSEMEVRMAELVQSMMPSMEMVRMVNSGTEATMSAIRVARAFTGRAKILKFEGCYHGHGDSFLIKAGSGALTLGTPSSPGVPELTASMTINARYNDLDSVQAAVDGNPGEIAAIIVEPVAANMGVVLPHEGFLEGLRELCTREGIMLIFDEVMTGFRLAPGGAQELFGVRPDLTTLGKIIGGGLPVGAYGGRRDIMSLVAPSGPVYQAGTLSGNPLAMSAGFATLSVLNTRKEIYRELEKKKHYLLDNFHTAANEAGVPVQINHVGSKLTVFFSEFPVVDYFSALQSDTGLYGRFFHAMLGEGVYLPPAQFEAMFLSTAHTEADLERTAAAFRSAIRGLGRLPLS